MRTFTYIDLFAGAGGLSEGFIRAGFEPIAHVEIDEAAHYTLKTRTAYHHLNSTGEHNIYIDYLKKRINREQLYSYIPEHLLNSVLNRAIGTEDDLEIHSTIKKHLGVKKVDVIIGGPPCQAYSVVGRARSSNGMEGDHRNFLYIHYAKYLAKYKPQLFVFENVLGLKSAGNGFYLEEMKKLFFNEGYEMRLFTVEANNFGVLQKRKRIIIIGWKKSMRLNVTDLEKVRTIYDCKVKSLLEDLPHLQSGMQADSYSKYIRKPNAYLVSSNIRNNSDLLTQHIARPHSDQDKEIYRIAVQKWDQYRERLNYNDLPERLKTHKNRESFFDRFKVVAADEKYSQTIVAHISKDGHYYIHPDIEQNRSITVREAARLQSFPDNYYFEGIKEGGSRTAAFKQIGNAVPPLMAHQIANLVKELLI